MAGLKTAFAGHPDLISGLSPEYILEYIKEICIIPYLFTKDLAEFGFEFNLNKSVESTANDLFRFKL